MKTKNILGIVAVCLSISACYYYNPEDRGAERAEKLAMKRAQEGCLLLDDHEAYRNCIIATMKRNSPKTYIIAENSNGDPVAIIKSDVPCDGACRASQTTIQTEVKKVVITEPTKIIEKTTTEVKTPDVQIEEVAVQKPVQEQPKEKTWWDNYQENKPADTTAPVKCPCEDPNDPCPQCVEK